MKLMRTRRSLIFCAVIGCALLTVACDVTEVSSFPSPDRKFDARLLDDRGASPTVSAYETVQIRSHQGIWPTTDVVFQGANMGGRATRSVLFGPLNVSWPDEKTLLIEYCDGDVQRHVSHLVRDGVTLTVKLVQEPHGNWPSSIPVDRRMGSPPCI